jgi:hypothetical protein
MKQALRMAGAGVLSMVTAALVPAALLYLTAGQWERGGVLLAAAWASGGGVYRLVDAYLRHR